MSQFAQENNIAPDVNWVLRIKDEIMMSDKNYFLFTNKLGLTGGYLPCKTKVLERRQEINKECMNEFEVDIQESTITVVKKKVESVAQCICSYVNPLQIIEYLKIIGKTNLPEVKLSYDGAAKGIVNVSARIFYLIILDHIIIIE